MVLHVRFLEIAMFAHVLQVIQELHVNSIQQVNSIISFMFIYIFIYLAVCSLNLDCSPGYCFNNPSGQPRAACYCPDHTIHLKSCLTRWVLEWGIFRIKKIIKPKNISTLFCHNKNILFFFFSFNLDKVRCYFNDDDDHYQL
jgi:hypothetical protein